MAFLTSLYPTCTACIVAVTAAAAAGTAVVTAAVGCWLVGVFHANGLWRAKSKWIDDLTAVITQPGHRTCGTALDIQTSQHWNGPWHKSHIHQTHVVQPSQLSPETDIAIITQAVWDFSLRPHRALTYSQCTYNSLSLISTPSSVRQLIKMYGRSNIVAC
jgi:hypothetical protein